MQSNVMQPYFGGQHVTKTTEEPEHLFIRTSPDM